MLRSAPATWRPNLLLRLFLGGVGVFMAVMAWIPYDDSPSYWADWGLRLWLFVMGAGLLVGLNRPYLRLDGDTLIAQGLVFRQETPVAAVVDVGAGREGVLIEYIDGSTFVPTFVGEKGIGLQLLGWRTAGDSIADRVMAAAARARREQRESTVYPLLRQYLESTVPNALQGLDEASVRLRTIDDVLRRVAISWVSEDDPRLAAWQRKSLDRHLVELEAASPAWTGTAAEYLARMRAVAATLLAEDGAGVSR